MDEYVWNFGDDRQRVLWSNWFLLLVQDRGSTHKCPRITRCSRVRHWRSRPSWTGYERYSNAKSCELCFYWLNHQYYRVQGMRTYQTEFRRFRDFRLASEKPKRCLWIFEKLGERRIHSRFLVFRMWAKSRNQQKTSFEEIAKHSDRSLKPYRLRFWTIEKY